MPGALAILLAQFDQAYDHRSWHGPNLRGSLRGLTLAQAFPPAVRSPCWNW